jgi:hypothetical protein
LLLEAAFRSEAGIEAFAVICSVIDTIIKSKNSIHQALCYDSALAGNVSNLRLKALYH